MVSPAEEVALNHFLQEWPKNCGFLSILKNIDTICLIHSVYTDLSSDYVKVAIFMLANEIQSAIDLSIIKTADSVKLLSEIVKNHITRTDDVPKGRKEILLHISLNG